MKTSMTGRYKRTLSLLFTLLIALALIPITANADGDQTTEHICSLSFQYNDNPAALPNGSVGQFYSVQIQAEGCAPVTFINYDDLLPPGLALDANGIISGTPPLEAAGTYTFLVNAFIDYEGHECYSNGWMFTIEIADAFSKQLRVRKVDQNGNPLAGAVIALGPRYGYESPLPTFEVVTGSDGNATITVTKPGYYTLYEKTPPAGYDGSDDEHNIIVNINGVWMEVVGTNGLPYEPVTFVNRKLGGNINYPDGYIVHFDLQGGTGNATTTDQSIAPSGGYAVKPVADPVKDGFLFIGWYHAPGSTMMWDFNNTLVSSETGDVTIYAKWAPALERGDHFRYINGYTDGTVRPENPIARSEVAAIFFRIITDPDKNDPLTTSFPDVDPIYKWSYQPIAYLEAHGIITGYPDGRFGPDDPITRAEFAAIAARFDALIIDDTNIFADVSDTYWAKGYINSAYNHGWINGYDDGFTLTFRPRANITRAEVMTIVNRMLDRRIRRADVPAACNPFSDLDYDYWAYATVLEASIAHDYERQDDGYELWTDWTPWS